MTTEVNDDSVSVDVQGHLATIRWHRESKRNSLTSDLLGGVHRLLTELEMNHDVRVIALRGNGTDFSSGMDLNQAVAVDSPLDYLLYHRVWTRLMTDIEACLKPVIAVIDGYCFTGGLELALACDRRIATTDARFSITSSRIGSVAGAGATQRLPRVVGVSEARRLIFTGDPIDSDEALRIGLVDEVVAPQDLDDAAQAFAEKVAESAPISVALHKLAINNGLSADLQTGLALEAALSGQAFMTEDKREGMSAFLEKRDPGWKAK